MPLYIHHTDNSNWQQQVLVVMVSNRNSYTLLMGCELAHPLWKTGFIHSSISHVGGGYVLWSLYKYVIFNNKKINLREKKENSNIYSQR